MLDFETPFFLQRKDEYVEPAEVPPAPKEDVWRDAVRFLRLFDAHENIQLCIESDEGRPGHGRLKDSTAGDLLRAIEESGNVDAMAGAIGPDGAWVGFNPIDGQGCRDSNVTSFRHALLQSDDGEIDEQLAIIQKLKVPCACIIHSGGRSLHAIVRVEAPDARQYRDRVDQLYAVAERAGLKVDRKHRGASRLTRLPGVRRGNRWQYIVAERCGADTWEDWAQYVEDLYDDLPDIERLDSMFSNPPPLSEEMIEGVLRKGHRMMLAASSGAGKSFCTTELAIAAAEGVPWLGRRVKTGRILVVDTEMDRPSLIHRFIQVYDAMGVDPLHLDRIEFWCLRGRVRAMEGLLPKLIRRAQEAGGYEYIVLDPIYTLNPGDEKDAQCITMLMNCFSELVERTGASLIYTHHHSKGEQGHKASMDRASGSGVYARAPDATMDMIELQVSDERRKVLSNYIQREHLLAAARRFGVNVEEGQAEGMAEGMLQSLMALDGQHGGAYGEAMTAGNAVAQSMTGWRVSGGKIREFARPSPYLTWFRHPIHIPDTWGLLADAVAAGEEPEWMERQRKKEKFAKVRKSERDDQLTACVEKAGVGIAVKTLAESMGIGYRALAERLKKHPKYGIEDGQVVARGKSKGKAAPQDNEDTGDELE